VDGGAETDALHVRQSAASIATRSFEVPPNVTLAAVKLGRTTALTSGQTYVADAGSTVLDTRNGGEAPLKGEKTVDATGTQLSVRVSCPAGDCTSGGVDLTHVAMRVQDGVAPRGAVGGWRSPASDTLQLDVQATDVGVGLKSATAYLDGTPVSTAMYGDGSCTELSEASGQIDLPFGAVAQHDTAKSSVGCYGHGAVALPVNTRSVPNGNHTISVTVSDWAGNTTTLMDNVPTEVLNDPYLGTNVATLNIGTSGTTTTNATTNPTAGSGGVAGASAQSCRSPRLSFSLSQKPLRISNGVAVLQYGKRYRFNGRLTCVIDGKRKSAPKRARVDILNKVGKKTIEKAGTTVRDQGKLTVILSYKSSRTITFRFTNTGGQRSTVAIKVKVEKKTSSRR
jgi:hypothetical protein